MEEAPSCTSQRSLLLAGSSIKKEETHACAPSDNAMNGNNDQSFSTDGFDPSSAKHNSISGPLHNRDCQQYQWYGIFSSARLIPWGRHGATEKGAERKKKETNLA
jgi:hypothetical protein